MAREEAVRRGAEVIDTCFLARADLEQARIVLPPADPYGHPEFGNCSLTIPHSETMMIADRAMLRNRIKLDAEWCVIMDEFGGDFGCDSYTRKKSELLIPIGHTRQGLWPDKFAMKRFEGMLTDGGSIAFVPSGRIKEEFRPLFTPWRCKPGNYHFYYEEIVQLGALQQPMARNVLVVRSNS